MLLVALFGATELDPIDIGAIGAIQIAEHILLSLTDQFRMESRNLGIVQTYRVILRPANRDDRFLQMEPSSLVSALNDKKGCHEL